MDGWTFPGYEKIAESAGRWRLDASGWKVLRRVKWVVTEKIHGANFCLATDGSTVRCANRRAWLAEEDEFFGWQRVRDELAPAVQDLFGRVRATVAPDINHLYVYGELFGGGYPHPEVVPVLGVQPVQTGVWYAPDVRFCAFDLRVKCSNGSLRYLDYAGAVPLLETAGVLCAEPLFVGGYEAASEYPIRFDSTLPRRLSLPSLPVGTNPAEGVVIKPWREVTVHDIDRTPLRPIFKRKIPEFAEDRRFHEAQRGAAGVTQPVAATDPLDLLKWEVYCRMTENRLHAAVSKIGPADGRGSRAGLLFALLVDEVLGEATDAAPDIWASLSAEGRDTLRAYAEGEVWALLRRAYRH